MTAAAAAAAAASAAATAAAAATAQSGAMLDMCTADLGAIQTLACGNALEKGPRKILCS